MLFIRKKWEWVCAKKLLEDLEEPVTLKTFQKYRYRRFSYDMIRFVHRCLRQGIIDWETIDRWTGCRNTSGIDSLYRARLFELVECYSLSFPLNCWKSHRKLRRGYRAFRYITQHNHISEEVTESIKLDFYRALYRNCAKPNVPDGEIYERLWWECEIHPALLDRALLRHPKKRPLFFEKGQ